MRSLRGSPLKVTHYRNLRSAERCLPARNRWSISSIVLWELARLVQRGRVDLDLDDRGVVRFLSRKHRWPADLDAARALTCLDSRSDPADEIIAATSVVHGVPLLTRDQVILNSKQVPLAA